jgi:hypothetical protein
MMVKSMQRDLIIVLDIWRFIAVCNKSRMRKFRLSWHHLDLHAQHSSGGKASCKMACNKWVMYFHHGKVLFLHLESDSILWVINRKI